MKKRLVCFVLTMVLVLGMCSATVNAGTYSGLVESSGTYWTWDDCGWGNKVYDSSGIARYTKPADGVWPKVKTGDTLLCKISTNYSYELKIKSVAYETWKGVSVMKLTYEAQNKQTIKLKRDGWTITYNKTEGGYKYYSASKSGYTFTIKCQQGLTINLDSTYMSTEVTSTTSKAVFGDRNKIAFEGGSNVIQALTDLNTSNPPVGVWIKIYVGGVVYWEIVR